MGRTPDRHSNNGGRAPWESRYSALCAAMPWGYALSEVEFDKAGNPRDYRLIETNEAFAHQTGLHGAEVSGKTLRDLFPGFGQAWFEMLDAVAQSGDEVHAEQYAAEQGRYLDFVAFRPESGQLAILVTDVTAHRHTEQYHQLCVSVVDSSDDAILTKDLDGTILSWNSGAERLYGYSENEMLGRQVAVLEPPEHRGEIASILARIRTGERVSHFETTRRRKDGSLVEVSVTVSPVKDEHGRLFAASTIARDITQRKRAEAALRRTTHELNERVKELSGLYSVASLTQEREAPFAEVAQGILRALVAAYRYPEITCARITFDGQQYCSEPFRPTSWRQAAEIRWNTRTAGMIEVFYREERPSAHEGPFLKEERALLDTVAELVSRNLQERQEWAAREQARLALRTSEARLRQVVDLIPDILYRVPLPGHHAEFVTPAIEHLLGFSAQEWQADPEIWVRQLHEEDRSRILAEMDSALSHADGYKQEYRIWHKDGRTLRWIEDRHRIERDSHDKPLTLFGAMSDITDRKRTERALQESEEKYRILVENLNEGIWLIDEEARTTFVNARMAELLGFEIEEMLDKPLFAFMEQHAADAAERNLARGRTGVQAEYDFEFRRKGGQPISTHIVTAPLFGHSGEYKGALAGVIDITERKRAEEELHRVNSELQQFAYIASHDLRAPLRAVSNLSNWLEEDLWPKLSDEHRRSLQLLRERVGWMDEFIQRLLAYSRAGGRTVQVEAVDAGQLVGETLESYEVPREFRISVAGDMPRLVTDRAKLRQVFSNLLGNAIKFHHRPDGHVWVSAHEAGECYEFSVADDGPGIPTEYQKRVFQMFQRGPTERGHEGTGIGLAVVKKVVESVGGRVELESVPGRGSTFRFTWPKVLDERRAKGPEKNKGKSLDG